MCEISRSHCRLIRLGECEGKRHWRIMTEYQYNSELTQARGDCPKQGTQILGHRNSTLHVIETPEAGALVYFTLSGSIARIDQRWAKALKPLEDGVETVASTIANAESGGDVVFADAISMMAAEGYLRDTPFAESKVGRILGEP